jgi:serine/threonine protein kinase
VSTPDKIRYRGKPYPVLDTMRIGGRQYFILRKLRGGLPGRLQAFDPKASPEGAMRCIHLLPKSKQVTRRLKDLNPLSESNDNVPTIFEYHPRRDDIVVVCNWIWGTPLQTYLDEVNEGTRRPFSSYEATRLFCGLAHGISQLHYKKGIVHGDIKPDNLIVTHHETRLVLIDFGAAWKVERMVDRDPNDGVSPVYAAPEVLRAEPASFASEQFSASVVYYQMLTNQIPYDRLGGMAGAGADGPPAGLSLALPSRIAPHRNRTPRHIWKQIDDVARRGLQLDRKNRYANRSEWLAPVNQLRIAIQMEHQLTGRNQAIVGLIEKVGRIFRRS